MGCGKSFPSSPKYLDHECHFCDNLATEKRDVGFDQYGRPVRHNPHHIWYCCNDHKNKTPCGLCFDINFNLTNKRYCIDHACIVIGCESSTLSDTHICYSHICQTPSCQRMRTKFTYVTRDSTSERYSNYCDVHKCPTETCDEFFENRMCYGCGFDPNVKPKVRIAKVSKLQKKLPYIPDAFSEDNSPPNYNEISRV